MNIIDSLLIHNPFLNVYKRAEIWKKELGYIGDNVQIFHKVSFGSEPYLIEIGDLTKITYGCQFITHDGGTYVLRNMYQDAKNISVYGKITIGKNCFLGNNVVVLPGVTIGDNCVIGAGSVVTRSIEANSVAAGVPCKVISSIDDYYKKLGVYFHNTIQMNSYEKKKYILDIMKNNPDSCIKK